MYNLRYHIASLVGVFLALALGLVLGGLVVQRGTVSRQQTALVEGLQDEFETLRDDNAALEAQNEVLTSFAEEMSLTWVADRLVGQNIVVISRPGQDDALDAATEAITAAGGNPIVVAIEGDLATGDPSRSVEPSDGQEAARVLASVATSLAAEWAQPTRQRPITQALVDAGAMTVDELEPGMAAFGVVDIAVLDGEPDPAGLAIAQAFSARQAWAVAAESVAEDTGLASAAAARELSAFDTLGSGIGRYTLVALATGGKPGHYGLGEDVVAAYPEVPAE